MNYTGNTPSRLLEVKAQVGKIPLIRRTAFIYGALAALVLSSVVLLPPAGSPNGLGLARVYGFLGLAIAWCVLVYTDERIREWVKTLAVVGLLVLMAGMYYLYSTAQWGRVQDLFFNLKIIEIALPNMLQGLWITIQIAIFAALLSTVLGLLIAVFRSFNNRVLNIFIIAYVDFMRGMPIMVLLVLIYYALPYLGIRLDALMAGVIALGLNSSAYVSEIFRAGILSVNKGQLEAASALGLTPLQTMRLILLPQAFKVVLPPLMGNYVASAKDTALCSSISIIELMKAGLSQQAMLANPSPLIFSTALYLIMFVPLTRFSGWLEKRLKARRRTVNTCV